MNALLWAALILVGCFSFVLMRGAPFVPTLRPQIDAALDLLDLAPRQTLLELGCGDGRVLLAAARRGLCATGYELNPLLAMLAWLRTRRYAAQVRVVWGDYWRVPWPAAEGAFAFILPRYMPKLDAKIHREVRHPFKVASFAFTIPGKQPVAQRGGVFLYQY